MKPRKGAIILIIPVLMVVFVFVAYGIMFGLGIYGRPADGRRVELTWETCAEAQAVVAKRVEGMGLGDPAFKTFEGGFTLEVTLPADETVAADIPRTLATPAFVRAHPEGRPQETLLTSDDIAAGAIRQDLTLMPWTVLTLKDSGLEKLSAFVDAEREGKVVYLLDNMPVGTVSNLKGKTREVEWTPEGEDERTRMHRAAERSILVDSGPLPCAMTRVRRD